MTKNETEAMRIILEHENPEQALKEALELFGELVQGKHIGEKNHDERP